VRKITLFEPAVIPGQVKARGKFVKATSLYPDWAPPTGSSTTLAFPGKASKFRRSNSQKLCIRIVFP
jgi:hypothetical protein